MTAWFLDRVLPGLVVAGLVGASHLHLLGRIRKLTAEQTREIKGGSGEGSSRADD